MLQLVSCSCSVTGWSRSPEPATPIDCWSDMLLKDVRTDLKVREGYATNHAGKSRSSKRFAFVKVRDACAAYAQGERRAILLIRHDAQFVQAFSMDQFKDTVDHSSVAVGYRIVCHVCLVARA